MPIARWTLLSRSLSLARSSHCLAITSKGIAALYGGELKPRSPVDAEGSSRGTIHELDIVEVAVQARNGSLSAWKTNTVSGDAPTPDPRVGAAAAVINDDLYVWGGRGGVDMAPIGGLQAGFWRTSLSSRIPTWERIAAANEDAAPQPRSYHAIVAHNGKLYVHAGCPTSGRISELHSFDVSSRKWAQLATAPEPGRGGTVLARSRYRQADVFLRFAGFAGYELGADHTLDIYDIASNIWNTVVPGPDPVHGFPGPRSVHGFVGCASIRFPNIIAVLCHGERDPSSQGHAGAGRFWDDVWALAEGQDEGENGGLQWVYIPVEGSGPEARGWFPSASFLDEQGETKVLLQGGLLANNERSDETWLLQLHQEQQS